MTNATRFLKANQVCDLAGFSRTELYRRIKAGKFPKPLSLGPAMSRWDEAEIIAWQEKQRAAAQASA